MVKKVRNFIRKLFTERKKKERALNHHDLLMLDFEICKLLLPNSLKQSVKKYLEFLFIFDNKK